MVSFMFMVFCQSRGGLRILVSRWGQRWEGGGILGEDSVEGVG